MSDWLARFVAESNRIEGILREPTEREVFLHQVALEQERFTVKLLENFVAVVQPDARLRSSADVPGVRVGDHVAPESGPQITKALEWLLECSRGRPPMEGSEMVQVSPNTQELPAVKPSDPFSVHRAYEWLHPFTDGNGRSGRALWLWMMERRGVSHREQGFLHTWYYQSLEGLRC
jgi:hypothetical protein